MQKHTEELTRQTILLGDTDKAKVKWLMALLHLSKSATVRLAIDALAQMHEADVEKEIK